MSDDERMDRAERIRQMREGGRSDDEASDDESTASDEPESGDDESAGAEGGVEVDADAAEMDETGVDGAGTDETGAESGTATVGTGTVDASSASTDESATATTDSDAEGLTDGDDSEATHAEATDGARGADQAADDESTLHVPGAEVGDVDVDVEEMAQQAGLSSAEADDGGEASDDAELEGPAGLGAGRDTDVSTIQQNSAETRVLEFGLGHEKYCLDIEYIEEIVKRETITRVPNTPDYVEGVVDLRGQITTIIDPKVPLDIEAEGTEDLIVVFDPEEFEEQGAIGWVVDDVNQVMPITDDEVNDPPLDDEHIIGVVDRDDEFVIWTTPDVALDEAAG